ncbi:hypothetical protein KIPB_017104, partial [Kipferlia bialata]|eukprot:g17104.t1
MALPLTHPKERLSLRSTRKPKYSDVY